MEQFEEKNPNESEALNTQTSEEEVFTNPEKKVSYKKEWWEKKGKKYHRITIRLEKDDFEKIERISDKKKLRPSEVLQAITSNTLNGTGETLHIESKEDTQSKQEIIKQALQVFRNLGTNINQIARDINERRLVGGIFSNPNITKSEKEQLLSTIQKMETEMMDFIKNNL